MYELSYAAWCELRHCMFALLFASGPLYLTWTTCCRRSLDRHTLLLLCSLGFALAATSHYLADFILDPMLPREWQF